MKLHFVILLLYFAFSSFAQTNKTIDEIFNGRKEIYFRFPEAQVSPSLNFYSIVSLDKINDGFIYAYANKKQFTNFLYRGLSYEKLTAPSLLLPEKALNMRNNIDLNNRASLAWDYYPSYTAYVSLMQQFATNYPTICQLDTIGTSVEGRLLLVVRISDNVNTDEYEPEFFYSSTMHGDECTGYVIMLHLIDYLLTNYSTNTRVNNIVNNMDIYINPNANPDGTYANGDTTVSGAMRLNANGEDLNRNYPVPDNSVGDDGTYVQQPETQAFIDFIEERDFVASANYHGGIELMNYPWDYTSDNHADKAWWMYVCKEYADTAQANSHAEYFDASPSMYVGSPDYPGVVEGYSWYPALGSRQDYSQYFAQCREVTIEISDTKTPSANTLESYWNYNYKSIFNYMEQAQYGIKGIVTDNCTGLPIKALITITSHDIDSSMVYSSLPVGNYHRPIAPGIWGLSVSASGYQTATAIGVVTTNKITVVQDFALVPIAPPANFSSNVTSTCSGDVQFTSIGTYPAESTFSWNFGDGIGVSAQQNPAYDYTDSGWFNVSLIVAACGGFTDTTCQQIHVILGPTASFSTIIGPTGQISHFTDLSSGNGSSIVSWLWAFGDGTTSVQQHPAHVFSNEGIFTVTLIVFNECGSDTTSQQVAVIANGVESVETALFFYPNPISGETATLEFTSMVSNQYKISIFSAEGKMVYQSSMLAQAGKNKAEICIQNLAEGVYWLELSSQSTLQRIQLLK